MTAAHRHGNGRSDGDHQQGPPSFEAARNRRQRARATGLAPDHWYAVEQDTRLKNGQVVEVKFWGRSVALYRDEQGALHALENRCAHRQLKLSLGVVSGEKLICQYHGWTYDTAGTLCSIPHEDFGRGLPRCRVPTYPVRVRYGLIWIFFGAPDQAQHVAMPEIPELEGPDRWASIIIDYTWTAHYSMIVENICDFTHEFLHRKRKPFENARLRNVEQDDDRVLVAYDTKVAAGAGFELFVDRTKVRADYMELAFEYPYQWSNTGDAIKDWCFMLPLDERTTRCFFVFYFMSFKVPFLPLQMPRWLMKPILEIARPLALAPLLDEDGFALEAEQDGWERHWDAPNPELNPAVHAMQDLTIRKWEQHLERERGNSKRRRANQQPGESSDDASGDDTSPTL